VHAQFSDMCIKIMLSVDAIAKRSLFYPGGSKSHSLLLCRNCLAISMR